MIVAHGQPSDPAPMAAELRALAAQVAGHLPGWQVGAATLAERGALAQAVAGPEAGVIFPLFMAAGWFTQSAIPQRLAEAGADGWRILTPFGETAVVQDLAVTVSREAGVAEVLLAAHGSFKSAAPAAVAGRVAARIADQTGARVEAAFIDQSPRLAEVQGFGPAAICLPFFAMAGGHVTQDLPQALAQAGFAGRILPALGCDARVPALIAGLIRDA